MSEQVSLVQEGIDRIQSAADTIDRDFRKFQKNLRGQRKDFEKRTRKCSRNLGEISSAQT